MILTVVPGVPAATADITGVSLIAYDLRPCNRCWSAPKLLLLAGAKGRGLAMRAQR